PWPPRRSPARPPARRGRPAPPRLRRPPRSPTSGSPRAARSAPGNEGSRRPAPVRQLRLLLGIEVVEVAEELVEAVRRREELVLVAQVVLAELSGGIAQRLQQL